MVNQTILPVAQKVSRRHEAKLDINLFQYVDIITSLVVDSRRRQYVTWSDGLSKDCLLGHSDV